MKILPVRIPPRDSGKLWMLCSSCGEFWAVDVIGLLELLSLLIFTLIFLRNWCSSLPLSCQSPISKQQMQKHKKGLSGLGHQIRVSVMLHSSKLWAPIIDVPLVILVSQYYLVGHPEKSTFSFLDVIIKAVEQFLGNYRTNWHSCLTCTVQYHSASTA